MSDLTLQKLTASEPLTLDEKYEMQGKHIRCDALSKTRASFPQIRLTCLYHRTHLHHTYATILRIARFQVRLLPLIGDVNLFLR